MRSWTSGRPRLRLSLAKRRSPSSPAVLHEPRSGDAFGTYAWWSGLTVRDAKAGIELAALEAEEIDGRTYWFYRRNREPRARPLCPRTCLPNYDEYLIAYKDRGPVVGDSGRDVFAHYFVVAGRLAGSWKRTLNKDSVVVEAVPYRRLRREDRRRSRCVRRALRTVSRPQVAVFLPKKRNQLLTVIRARGPGPEKYSPPPVDRRRSRSTYP